MVLNATLIVRGTCLYFALLNPIGGQILMRFHKALIDLRQEGITSKAIFDDCVEKPHTRQMASLSRYIHMGHQR